MATMMAPTRSVKTQWASGVGGRDTEFPAAPIHVSGHAQAKNINMNDARMFDFGVLDRETPQIPSPSGGSTAKFSMRKSTEKRGIMGDLHVNPLPAHGEVMTLHDFSLPEALPTPENTPHSSPQLSQRLSPQLPDSPESMDPGSAIMNVVREEIGMALGSPTHEPTAWRSQTPAESITRTLSPPPTLSRQKSRRWKLLGGFFGGGKKNNVASAEPFYQLQPQATFQTTVEGNYINFREPSTSTEKKPPRTRGRGKTTSERKNETSKPDMKRANTVPSNFDFQDWERRQMNSSKVSREGGLMLDVEIPSTQLERYSIMFGSVLQKAGDTSSSLLARRQATLDRLKTVNKALASSQELLLDEHSREAGCRRASSPQPMKSPTFSLIPSTPSQPQARDAPPFSSTRQHPSLHRSNTSPAGLSPYYPSFPSGSAKETYATLLEPGPHIPVNPKLEEHISSQRRQKLKKSLSIKPQQMEDNWSPEQFPLTRESPVNNVEGCEVEDSYDPTPSPMKAGHGEQTWQMTPPSNSSVAPVSVSGSSTSRSVSHSITTSASSVSTVSSPRSASSNPKQTQMQASPPTTRSRSATTSSTIRPRPSENFQVSSCSPSTSISKSGRSDAGDKEYDEREENLKMAADISIARQISVSRQQRQLLIPITRSGSTRGNYNSPSSVDIGQVASPLCIVAAGIDSPVAGKTGSSLVQKNETKGVMNERLMAAAAKPSTPQLVVVEGDASEQTWGGDTAAARPSFSERGSGEIKVGLVVGSSQMIEHRHKKSEWAIVEQISTESD